MMVGLAALVLLGLLGEWGARRLGLPGLVGMLAVGMLVGPHALNLLGAETRAVAVELRSFALVVILLRAGLGISRAALAKVGGRALLLAFLPGLGEVAVVTLVGPALLPLTHWEAALLGAVLAGASPAVIVPQMVRLIEEQRGAKNGAPTLVLAGAAGDNAVAILLCGALVSWDVGDAAAGVWRLGSLPLALVSGLVAGAGLGWLLCRLFDRFNPRATKRLLILLGLAVLLLQGQPWVQRFLPFAALPAILAMGLVLLELREGGAHELAAKLAKLWIFAELLLFTLVGAQVDLPVALRAGLGGAAVIALGLLGRTLGVQLTLLGSRFTRGERWFVVLSYLPKATVQAAIGATPLLALQAAGRHAAPGELILAVAVLAILLTAPAGAALIAWAGCRLLPP